MRGFAGVLDTTSPEAERGRLERALGALTEGRKGDGAIVTCGRVGVALKPFGDVSCAAMFAISADRSRLLVHDGSLYNLRALQNELRLPGGCDEPAGLLLSAFEELGEALFEKLEGMFSIAVFDSENGRLTLARDHFGLGPLYYGEHRGQIYFGTRVDPLLAAGLPCDFDEMAAMAWVFTGWSRDERSLLEKVHRVASGTHLTCRYPESSWNAVTYYGYTPDWERAATVGDTEEEWLQTLEEELRASIETCMSDGGLLGVFCSGGVDSSLVAAMAAKTHPNIRAYTMSLPDQPHLDESRHACDVAARAGIEIEVVPLQRSSYQQELVRAVYYSEMPVVSAGIPALRLLAGRAHQQGVTRALTGEGSDTLLGGLIEKDTAVERIIRSKIAPLRFPLEKGVDLFSKIARKMGWQPDFEEAFPTVHIALCNGFDEWRIFREGMELYEGREDEIGRRFAARMYQKLHTVIDPAVHFFSSVTNSVSVELRYPFLNRRLNELGLSMPTSYKLGVNGFSPVSKPLVRRLAERYVPRSAIYRPKLGFTIESQGISFGWPQAWLDGGFLVEHFDIDSAGLRDWTMPERFGQSYTQSQIMMINLEVWGQLFVRRRSVEDVHSEFIEAQDRSAFSRSISQH